jgi:hypothetical protein
MCTSALIGRWQLGRLVEWQHSWVKRTPVLIWRYRGWSRCRNTAPDATIVTLTCVA